MNRPVPRTLPTDSRRPQRPRPASAGQLVRWPTRSPPTGLPLQGESVRTGEVRGRCPRLRRPPPFRRYPAREESA
jgi:hypothetical protein